MRPKNVWFMIRIEFIVLSFFPYIFLIILQPIYSSLRVFLSTMYFDGTIMFFEKTTLHNRWPLTMLVGPFSWYNLLSPKLIYHVWNKNVFNILEFFCLFLFLVLVYMKFGHYWPIQIGMCLVLFFIRLRLFQLAMSTHICLSKKFECTIQESNVKSLYFILLSF